MPSSKSSPDSFDRPSLRIVEPQDPGVLLGEIQTSLKGYLISLSADPREIDDLLQETNHYLIAHFEDFEPGTNFKAWAFSVARYRLLAHHRDRARSKVSYFSDETLAGLADAVMERMEGEDERIRMLGECLLKLSTAERALVRRFYFEQQSVTELAAKLDRSANSLHKFISRIRQALRVCVEKHLSKR